MSASPEKPAAVPAEKATRRTRKVGTVVSAKMEKTVVVEVVRRAADPVYKKYVRQRRRYKAHDEGNQLKVGDQVVRRMDRAGAFFERREKQGLVMAPDEQSYFKRYAQKTIGKMYLCDVRPVHIQAIVDGALTAGRKRETNAISASLERLCSRATSKRRLLLIRHQVLCSSAA